MGTVDVHADVARLAGLIGTWSGRGEGHYPTIEPFAYVEEVTFGHVGKPFLAYTQRTRRLDADGQPGAPLHTEAGYLRMPDPDGDAAEFMVAQPTGVVEVSEGTWTDGVLDVRARLLTSASAKRVDALRRRFVLDGDTLTYDLWMAAVGEPEQHHLSAKLHRQ